MKKVLILGVIAMLALGVMALANTAGYYEQVTQGATCQQASLSVNSMIGIEQGYVATATSYNASFCGASGNPLTGHYVSLNSQVLLAELSVKSNMSTIGVTVAFSSNFPNFSNYSLSSYINYSDNYSNGSLTLQNGGYPNTPYEGTLEVYAPSSIPQWVTAGTYQVTTTFTITPKNNF
ncbi:hypothetical protein [Athalassotoga saccharophila]|uniref:hypothetical protein n=1 Tax=Athalassotoga saccharophila TaxID=1441386 RepID=UPI00137A310C|nr:hypothetical protein [Athalassotoga saccharophila]BBJ28975.1 hypothetical protein ATHSA_1900 [Athalassotoga saccharophila]